MRCNRIVSAVAFAAMSLGVVACADDDDESLDSLEEDIESAATDVEEAAQSAVTNIEQAVDDAATDAAEAAVRNIAAEQGEEQFADAGHSLDDEGLACEATASDDAASVAVQCTGTTEDGGLADLSGQTDEFPGESITEIEGTFTGTVDGTEVFTTDSLGA
jgi:hypothetical protein